MKKKNIIKISAIVFSIILVIVAITTTTQSYFNKDNYAKNPTEYQTGLLSIEAVSKSNNISLSNTLPMSDTEGGQTEPYVFTIRNNGNVDYKFNIKLLSTSDNTFSPEYIKIKIDDEGVKTLSSLTDSIIKKDIILPAGETIDITLRVWLSSDTKNTEIGKTFNSKIVIDGQSIYTSTNTDIDTPLKDFVYYLGSETSSVSTIDYYNERDGKHYNIPVEPIPLASNEILLTRYDGKSKNVTIPDTYTIGDTTYNVVILTSAYLSYTSNDLDVEETAGIFFENKQIENVYLGKKIKVVNTEDPGGVYDENNAMDMFLNCTSLKSVSSMPETITTMSSTFYGCTSLVNAPEIPSSVTIMNFTFYGCESLVTAPEIPSGVIAMRHTFYGCTSLVNAPTIPNGVTSMEDTFEGCTSLVNAPEIPNKVTSMYRTFYGCTSLATAPVIPDSVTSMDYTFYGCTSLVNAPTIPNSVTGMTGTFQNCANLTGIVRVNSSKVSYVDYIFAGTSKSITVQVPSGSTTYTKMNALTTTTGKPSNVTLTTY